MTKIYGAGIRCATCGAEPWPDNPAIRESFDLLKIGGAWCCELHRPPKEKRVARVSVTPAKAIIEFERVFATETSRFEEAVAGCDDDSVETALEDFGGELGRALNDLKKVLAEQTPTRAEKVPQSKRASLKPISARERGHEGQGDLIADRETEGV